MLIAGFGWEILFYFIMISVVILFPFAVGVAFLVKKISKVISLSSWIYAFGCIGHLGGLGRLVNFYHRTGGGTIKPMAIWTIAGIIFFAISILLLFISKNNFNKTKLHFFCFFVLGMVPTVFFLVGSK